MSKLIPIIVPKNIIPPPNDDHVAYTLKLDGKIVHSYKTVNCYYSAMATIKMSDADKNNFQFKCYPSRTKSSLPSDLFIRWIDLCKENKIMVGDASFTIEENKNHLYIDCKGQNKHLIYASLCCYRWSENQVELPYTVIKLVEKSVPFFQALHYAMRLYVTNYNHSIAIITKNNSVYDNSSNCLLNGICMRLFFHGKAKNLIPASFTHINETIKGMANKLKAGKKSHINNPEDILWKEWSEFYLADKINERFFKVYDETMAKHGT